MDFHCEKEKVVDNVPLSEWDLMSSKDNLDLEAICGIYVITCKKMYRDNNYYSIGQWVLAYMAPFPLYEQGGVWCSWVQYTRCATYHFKNDFYSIVCFFYVIILPWISIKFWVLPLHQICQDALLKEEDPKGQGCWAHWIWGYSCTFYFLCCSLTVCVS